MKKDSVKPKKAQAAMEFLMTYGWAILIVVVVLGALIYLKVLSPDKMMPEKCIFASSSRLICSGINIESGVKISLKAKNPLNDVLTVISPSEISDDVNSCGLTGDVIIPKEGFAVLEFAGPGSAGTCAGLVASSSKIKADIKLAVRYSDGFEKTSAGMLTARAV